MSEILLQGEAEAFFAPVSSDVIDGLIGQYDNMKGRIEHIAEAVDQDAMRYFLDGNSGDTRYSAPSVERLLRFLLVLGRVIAGKSEKAMFIRVKR